MFYLCNAGAPIALFRTQALVVPCDPAATAQNLLAGESAFRLVIAAGIFAYAAYMVVAVLLYDLFRPVNRSLSLLAAVFCIAGAAIGAVGSLLQVASLLAAKAAAGAPGMQAGAYLLLKMYSQDFTLTMAFFGFYMALIGVLVMRSTFLPRIIGALTILTGASYLAHSFAYFITPPLAAKMAGLVYLFGLGELSFVLWILFAGVNASKWREQAGVDATAN